MGTALAHAPVLGVAFTRSHFSAFSGDIALARVPGDALARPLRPYPLGGVSLASAPGDAQPWSPRSSTSWSTDSRAPGVAFVLTPCVSALGDRTVRWVPRGVAFSLTSRSPAHSAGAHSPEHRAGARLGDRTVRWVPRSVALSLTPRSPAHSAEARSPAHSAGARLGDHTVWWVPHVVTIAFCDGATRISSSFSTAL